MLLHLLSLTELVTKATLIRLWSFLNHSKSMQYILCLNRKNANHEMEIKFGGFPGWEMTLRHSPGWLGSLEVVVGATTVNLGSI